VLLKSRQCLFHIFNIIEEMIEMQAESGIPTTVMGSRWT
jgi:hypothetical protein